MNIVRPDIVHIECADRTTQVRVSRPKIFAIILCGIASAAGIGGASAAAPDEESLSVVVRYDPQSLSTQDGARALYRKLAGAAARVCPADPSSPHFISREIQACRDQAVARAVFKINNPELVAVFNTRTRSG